MGKMEQILHFDWLPKHLASSRFSRVGSASKSFLSGKIINPLLTKHEVKMAEYWPRSFLHFIDLDE